MSDNEEEYEYPDEGEEEYEYEEEDDDDGNYDYCESPNPQPTRKLGPPPKPGSCLRQTSTSYAMDVPIDAYVIQTAAEVRPLLDALVDEVRMLLQVTPDEAQILLQYCQWDKEKLMNKYFEDMDKIRREAGIDLFTPEILESLAITCGSTSSTNANGEETQDGAAAQESEELLTCLICYDPEVPKSKAIGLGCQHFYCKDCYSSYLESIKADGPTCVRSRCVASKCTQYIPPSFFHKLLEPRDAARYDEYMLRNFVDRSKSMKYCPSAHCDKIAVGSGITTIKCSCRNPFCFRCGEGAHDPCSCKQLSDWNTKNSNDGETANWLLVNTKPCPKCRSPTEKNEGCNHMTCKSCAHHYCWICLGNWSDHNSETGGFYKCNRYEAQKKVNENSSDVERAKNELERYMHYYQRYMGHNRTLQHATNIRNKLDQLIDEAQKSHDITKCWIDVDYIKQAVDQLIECRRALKFTYVVGYFLEDGTPAKSLFEDHQAMLEKYTEKLHEYSQMPVEKLQTTVDRADVINVTKITSRFLESVLKTVADGEVHLADGIAELESPLKMARID